MTKCTGATMPMDESGNRHSSSERELHRICKRDL